MTLVPKTYDVLVKAVEDGIAYGINRAWKYHEGPTMTEAQMREKADDLEAQVLNSILEWFDIKDEEKPR